MANVIETADGSARMLVTELAARRRPHLLHRRPAARLEGLAWDALASSDEPLRAAQVAHWAEISVVQASKAIDRLIAAGLAVGAGLMPSPKGGRVQTYRVVDA